MLGAGNPGGGAARQGVALWSAGGARCAIAVLAATQQTV
jgi:hypothetical protein